MAQAGGRLSNANPFALGVGEFLFERSVQKDPRTLAQEFGLPDAVHSDTVDGVSRKYRNRM